MIELAGDADLPQYRRVAEGVCDALRGGRLVPGQPLPTHIRLAEQLGVTPATVRFACQWLKQRGLITARRGSGTRIADDALDRLDARIGSPFDRIAVVVGAANLTACRRHTVRVVADVIEGLKDVLGISPAQIDFVPALDRACLDGLTESSAVLVLHAERVELAILQELTHRNIPALCICGTPEDLPLPKVDYDHYQAARLAVEHLLACGYQKLGYIGEMGRTVNLAARFFEFTDVLFRAGLDFQVSHVREVRHHQPGEAALAALEMAQCGDVPEAVFVDTDFKAMEVISGLQRAGLKVPDDIGVVGHDDVPEAAHWVDPPLTTVRTPRREIGRCAGEMLLAWVDEKTPLETRVLPSQLIIRNSTRAARGETRSASEATHSASDSHP